MSERTEEERQAALLQAMDKAPHTICVDVDGTLTIPCQAYDVYDPGAPNMVTIAKLNAARARGARIIIHTCRVVDPLGGIWEESVRALGYWLERWEIPYDEIWTSQGKPFAHEYWDDKAVIVKAEGA